MSCQRRIELVCGHSFGIGLWHVALIECLKYSLQKVCFHLLLFVIRDSEHQPKGRIGSEIYLLDEKEISSGGGQESDCERDPIFVFNNNTHFNTVI